MMDKCMPLRVVDSGFSINDFSMVKNFLRLSVYLFGGMVNRRHTDFQAVQVFRKYLIEKHLCL